jgi:hypothetical protein
MSEREKRHFHRVGHDAQATLAHAANTWSCTVEDLSLKGCMVKLAQSWQVEPDQIYRLSIHLSYAIHIDMDVRLSHQQGLHVGFHCVSIDTDSVAQLRRLVELNLGDSALLERDLHMLLSGADSVRQ